MSSLLLLNHLLVLVFLSLDALFRAWSLKLPLLSLPRFIIIYLFEVVYVCLACFRVSCFWLLVTVETLFVSFLEF